MVLVWVVDDNQHTQGTCLEGMSFIRSLYCFVYIYNQEYLIGLRVAQLQAIFMLPEHL